MTPMVVDCLLKDILKDCFPDIHTTYVSMDGWMDVKELELESEFLSSIKRPIMYVCMHMYVCMYAYVCM